MAAHPLIGMWWLNNATQPLADRARYGLLGMQNADVGYIAALQAERASQGLAPGLYLGPNSTTKLNYTHGDYDAWTNVESRGASLFWAVKQVGPVLAAGVDDTADTLVFDLGTEEAVLRVAASSDDARRTSTALSLTSTTVPLCGEGGRGGGYRFAGASAFKGKTIRYARLRYCANNPHGDVGGKCYVSAELADDPATFSTSADFDTRLANVTAKVDWTIGAATQDGYYDSPDLTAMMQTIADRAGLADAVVLFAEDIANRSADADCQVYGYDFTPARAMRLVVGYAKTTGVVPDLAEGDMFAIGEELFRADTISGATVTVSRGTYCGRPALAHSSGAAAQALVTEWHREGGGNYVNDVTPNCPLVDVGHGAEDWNTWNARRLASDSAGFGGMIIDWCSTRISNLIGLSETLPVRDIDVARTNTAPASYAAFDAQWATGVKTYLAAARTSIGTEAVLVMNSGPYEATLEDSDGGPPELSPVNGSIFEGWPAGGTTAIAWWRSTVGYGADHRGSLRTWVEGGRAPATSMGETYVYDGPKPVGWTATLSASRLQKMRYGLTTAGMAGAWFSWEVATDGHGTLALLWADEFDNSGAGQGYLGERVGVALSVVPQGADLLSGDGAFGTQGQLDAWTLHVDSGAAAMTLEDGKCRIDVTALTTASGIYLTHQVTVEAGKVYRVTQLTKTENPYTPLASHYAYDGTANCWASGDHHYDTTERGNDWTFTAAHSGTGYLRLNVGDMDGYVEFDGVELREVVASAWRQDFERGVMVCNPEATGQTVSLGGTYRKLLGTQAPTVNDGSLVTSVTLAARDGIVLLTSPLISTGTLTLSGSASLTTSVTATGVLTLDGSASFSIPVVVTGALSLSGSASLSAANPIIETGMLMLSGSASVTTANPLSAMGILSLSGSAVLGGIRVRLAGGILVTPRYTGAMTNKLFRNETPPSLEITFEEAVSDYESVVVRFAEPRSAIALLQADVAMSYARTSGTVTLTDITDLPDGVCDVFVIGVNGDDESALFETPTRFIIRTLPTMPETVS